MKVVECSNMTGGNFLNSLSDFILDFNQLPYNLSILPSCILIDGSNDSNSKNKENLSNQKVSVNSNLNFTVPVVFDSNESILRKSNDIQSFIDVLGVYNQCLSFKESSLEIWSRIEIEDFIKYKIGLPFVSSSEQKDSKPIKRNSFQLNKKELNQRKSMDTNSLEKDSPSFPKNLNEKRGYYNSESFPNKIQVNSENIFFQVAIPPRNDVVYVVEYNLKQKFNIHQANFEDWITNYNDFNDNVWNSTDENAPLGIIGTLENDSLIEHNSTVSTNRKNNIFVSPFSRDGNTTKKNEEVSSSSLVDQSSNKVNIHQLFELPPEDIYDELYSISSKLLKTYENQNHCVIFSVTFHIIFSKLDEAYLISVNNFATNEKQVDNARKYFETTSNNINSPHKSKINTKSPTPNKSSNKLTTSNKTENLDSPKSNNTNNEYQAIKSPSTIDRSISESPNRLGSNPSASNAYNSPSYQSSKLNKSFENSSKLEKSSKKSNRKVSVSKSREKSINNKKEKMNAIEDKESYSYNDDYSLHEIDLSDKLDYSFNTIQTNSRLSTSPIRRKSTPSTLHNDSNIRSSSRRSSASASSLGIKRSQYGTPNATFENSTGAVFNLLNDIKQSIKEAYKSTDLAVRIGTDVSFQQVKRRPRRSSMVTNSNPTNMKPDHFLKFDASLSSSQPNNYSNEINNSYNEQNNQHSIDLDEYLNVEEWKETNDDSPRNSAKNSPKKFKANKSPSEKYEIKTSRLIRKFEEYPNSKSRPRSAFNKIKPKNLKSSSKMKRLSSQRRSSKVENKLKSSRIQKNLDENFSYPESRLISLNSNEQNKEQTFYSSKSLITNEINQGLIPPPNYNQQVIPSDLLYQSPNSVRLAVMKRHQEALMQFESKPEWALSRRFSHVQSIYNAEPKSSRKQSSQKIGNFSTKQTNLEHSKSNVQGQKNINHTYKSNPRSPPSTEHLSNNELKSNNTHNASSNHTSYIYHQEYNTQINDSRKVSQTQYMHDAMVRTRK